MKPILPFVETMITQVCNLSCLGCTNYSDLVHKGYVSWEEGQHQITSWLERVDILDFGIMGGEPLVNPEVDKWILGVREMMPNSQIRFTTNGTLLGKNLEIIDLLHSIGNCVFKITVHQKDSDVEDLIDYITSKYNWKVVNEYGITRYKTNNNFRFQVNRPERFLKTYQGSYTNMKPHNSDPNKAFEICCQQTCPLLYNGRIYKCSTSGLLADTLAKFNNPNLELWKPYITDGIGPDCTNEELQSFLNNFGRAESICGQCPTKANTLSQIHHYDHVSTRKIQC